MCFIRLLIGVGHPGEEHGVVHFYFDAAQVFQLLHHLLNVVAEVVLLIDFFLGPWAQPEQILFLHLLFVFSTELEH